jgi:hypothetical protein
MPCFYLKPKQDDFNQIPTDIHSAVRGGKSASGGSREFSSFLSVEQLIDLPLQRCERDCPRRQPNRPGLVI